MCDKHFYAPEHTCSSKNCIKLAGSQTWTVEKCPPPPQPKFAQ